MVQDTRPIEIKSTLKVNVSGQLIVNSDQLPHDTILVLPQADMEVAVDDEYEIVGKTGALVPANQFLIVTKDSKRGSIKLTGTGTVYLSSVSLVADYREFTDITKQIDPTFVGGGGGSSSPTNLGNIQTATGVEVTSSTGTNTILPLATTTLAGLLSPADKLKLDAATGTNLSSIVSPTKVTIVSDSGTDADIPTATTTNSGLLSPTDKTKLDGIIQENVVITERPLDVLIELRDQNNNILNSDVLAYSTTINSGVVRKATNTEASDGNNTNQYITPEYLSKYAGDTILFVSDTSVSPAVPQQPTDTEILTVVSGSSRIAYYTGTDVSTDPIKRIYYIDKARNIVQLSKELIGTDLGVNPTASSVTVTSSTGTDAVLPLATQVNAGLMSPADKTKLDNSGGTDLAATHNLNNVVVTSSTGTDATINTATTALSGVTKFADSVTAQIGTNTNTAVTPDELSKYPGKEILFVSETSVSPLVAGEPTDIEIQNAVPVADRYSRFIKYTGTDVSEDPVKYIYYIDKYGTVLKITTADKNITNLGATVTATDITVTSDTGTDAVLPLATTAMAGLLSPTDKVLINGGFPANLTSTVTPADITINSSSGTNATLPLVNGVNSGLMSPADKTKLDGLSGTNLSNTPAVNGVTINSSTGTGTTLPLADVTNAGLFTPADFAKLAGIEAGATADQIASEVPFTPYLTNTATNVQQAIQNIEDGFVKTTLTNIDINVAVGESIQAALDELSKYIYLGSAVGRVILGAGTHILNAPLKLDHPQPGKIIVRGVQNRNATVTRADYTGVKATDLTMLQGKYGTFVECASSFYITYRLGGLRVEDLLIYAQTGSAAETTYAFLCQQSGYLSLDRTAVHGFNNGVWLQYNSFAILQDSDISHSNSTAFNIWYLSNGTSFNSRFAYGQNRGPYVWQTAILIASSATEVFGYANEGVRVEAGGNAYFNGLIITGCTNYPVNATKAAVVYSYNSQYNNNGKYVNITDASYLYTNLDTYNSSAGSLQLYVNTGSKCSLISITNSQAGGIFQVFNDSTGVEAGTHTGTPVFSPTVGTVGNNGSVWR